MEEEAMMAPEAVAMLGMLGASLALDLVFGEPPAALHPVVWMGRIASAMERLPLRRPWLQLAYGAVMVLVEVAAIILPVWMLLGFLSRVSPVAHFLLGSFLLKSSFSVRGLFRAAQDVMEPLAKGHLGEARQKLRSLVSRDTASLGTPLVAAAAVESLAENTSDSFVAPLFYYVLFGVPGALGYRAINTLDAMVGYRGRYEFLGKASARLDDLANLVPARLTGFLLVAAGFLSGRGLGPSWRTMWRFHRATESPNAGWPMSAMAGALQVQLEKPGCYVLGEGGAAPGPATIAEAKGLARVAIFLAILIYVGLVVAKDRYLS